MDLNIGCTTRPYNKLGYQEAFQRVAAAGFSDVAVFAHNGVVPLGPDTSPQAVADIRRTAGDAGLTPSMVLGRTDLKKGLDAGLEELKRLIANAAALGAAWLLDCGTSDAEQYNDYRQLMRLAAPYAEQQGIKIALKPHGGIGLTSDDLLLTMREIDHPAFTLCYDPGNIIYYTQGRLRPETDVGKVAGAVSCLIVKDCTVEDGVPDVMVTAGDGLVDFSTVLATLAGNGFRGPAYVECVGGEQIPEIDRNLAFTLGYIKGILSTL